MSASSDRAIDASVKRRAAHVAAALALGGVAVATLSAACGSNGDVTTATGDSGSAFGADDGSTPSDDAGIVIIDAYAPDDARWDDSAAALTFDSGAPTCGFPTVCPQTRGIGTISGDTSPANNTVTTTGSTSEWISVRVTENNNSGFGHAMSITAKLTSAAATNYDLFVYVNDGSAKAECTKVAGLSSDPGSTDTASAKWGEGSVANGKVDDATVTIRVQHITGPCDTIDPWKLEVTGNTQ